MEGNLQNSLGFVVAKGTDHAGIGVVPNHATLRRLDSRRPFDLDAGRQCPGDEPTSVSDDNLHLCHSCFKEVNTGSTKDLTAVSGCCQERVR